MNDTPLMASDPTSPSGERRQVTVLFADMVGFTTISERLAEEGTYALIQPIYELMAGAVKEQGGSVKDFTGDGIMALFGAPEALEDAPLRACRAGLLIHERSIVQNARERGDPRGLGLGLWSLGWVDIVDEQYADALAHGEEGEKVAILPLDRLVSTQVKGIALVGLRQVVDGSRILTALREQFTKNDWRYNFYGTDLILSLALIMQGKFAKGVSQIRRHIVESERQGYRVVADWTRILLAEVYLELLTGKEKPNIRVLLRNLVFLICTLPFAAQMALRLLSQASANQQIGKSTAMAARISFGIGLACKVKKRGGEARVYLEQARQIAEPLKAAALLAKIDTALAELP
jgi:hypothetical protein